MRESRVVGTRAVGFLRNNDKDPLENHKLSLPAFSVGPSSARYQNAILMSFLWRAAGSALC